MGNHALQISSCRVGNVHKQIRKRFQALITLIRTQSFKHQAHWSEYTV